MYCTKNSLKESSRSHLKIYISRIVLADCNHCFFDCSIVFCDQLPVSSVQELYQFSDKKFTERFIVQEGPDQWP